jgi:hexosaminidase
MQGFRWLLLACAVCLSLQTVAETVSEEQEQLNLMPWPQQVSVQEGSLPVGDSMSVLVTGENSPRLQQALERFAARVLQHSGLPLKLENNTAKQWDKNLKKNRQSQSAQNKLGRNNSPIHLQINIASDAAEKNSAWTMGADESYQLTVTPEQIQLHAETTLGALHGLQTLLQLLHVQDQVVFFPLITITDAPRFPWRGALIDVSRHFFSVETLKRQIDAMAAAKLNVFHWHLTDDQGWRMESKVFPLLQQKASGGSYYTQVQIRELVDYAWQRGIHVLPEIDMPGHVSALALAYPELMSAPGPYNVEERWGVHKPTLNPANEQVYVFVEQLFAEVATLFPFDYIHIGGDEVDPEHWLANPAVKTFMREQQLADQHALQAYFNRRVAGILAQHQRKMIGWDEIQHPDLPRDIVIQSWQGQDALGHAVNNGFQGILSTGFYLDQPQPAAYHYRNELFSQPLAVDDQLHEGERWSIWSFEMPRKRGSAVRGQFTIITAADGKQRGFIDFAGKARRAVNELIQVHGETRFELDTWMGKVSSRLQLRGDELSGSMIVGNVHYAASGKKIAGSTVANSQLPVGFKPVAVNPQQQALILGGELALWAEMVNEDVIDLRLWPRAFVVAERLWSTTELRDEDSLYRRLQAVSDWSVDSLGLRHQQQQNSALEKLAGTNNIQPLLILSGAVEQAQYYHRHHEKSSYGFYSRKDPLNLFVDSLPAESVHVYHLQGAVESWLSKRDDAQAKQYITEQFNTWIENYPALIKIARAQKLESVETLAQHVQMVSQLGLHLITRIEQGKKLSAGEVREARALLYDAQQMHEEVVVAAAYPIEKLLDAAY